MAGEWWETGPARAEPPQRKVARRWGDKFRAAVRGVKLGVRGHSCFFVHFFFAVVAVAAALALRCELVEWCVVIGCVALVVTAELFNSAIETLFRGLDPEAQTRARRCQDISAGAVLVASFAAAVVGTLVLGHRLLAVLHVSGW